MPKLKTIFLNLISSVIVFILIFWKNVFTGLFPFVILLIASGIIASFFIPEENKFSSLEYYLEKGISNAIIFALFLDLMYLIFICLIADGDEILPLGILPTIAFSAKTLIFYFIMFFFPFYVGILFGSILRIAGKKIYLSAKEK